MNLILIILSVFIECFVVIYYSDAVMSFREMRFKSNSLIIIGYIIYCGICIFENTALNILAFVIINCIVLYKGFDKSFNDILFKTIILTILMMFSELVAAMFIDVKLESELYNNIGVIENLIFSVISKMLYWICIVLLKRISVVRNKAYRFRETYWLLFLPVSTCIFFWAFNKTYRTLDMQTSILFTIVSVLLILSNFIIYIVFDKIIDKNIEIHKLQAMEHKKEIDYKSYELIKEKYSELKILVHDFDKYCNNIEATLSDSNTNTCELLHRLKNKNKEFLLVEYTDNNALNILLSQKMKECNKQGINFQIYVRDVQLSFIDEMDIISIFANLIDNAIESCKSSMDKKIFLSIYPMNNSFVVIRIDNSSDTPPIISDGKLRTTKKDHNTHGIGITSIEKSLTNYNGKMQWSYDKSARVFNTTILINYYRLNYKK